jgi:Reverse transcriptase (RNA-dependent DNA polymerase)
MALINQWETRQIDFVLAYTQAEVECELYMSIPKGLELKDKSKDYVLKLKQNLFGQKQAGRVWNKHLVKALKQVGFDTSKIDECLFYKGKVIFVLFTDDSILTGPSPKELDKVIQDMEDAGLILLWKGI